MVKKNRVTLGQICETVCYMIQGLDPAAPPFPGKYHVYKDTHGNPILLKEGKEQVVRQVSANRLAADILQYLKEHYSHLDDYKLTPDKAETVAKFFMLVTEPLPEEPKPFREKSEAGLCFSRLPFDVEKWQTAQMPLFRELLARTTNQNAFCAFIGSIFYSQADRQQYLYLYGSGQNGKGAILRLLAKVLGKSYSSEDANLAVANRFWTAGLLGKRLVAFPDTNYASFLRTGLLKTLTGNDAVRVEKKNLDPYTVSLNCKLMFLSNKKPDISGEKADVRRLIFCTVGDFAGNPDPNYDEKLWQEAPAIISFCKAVYLSACPEHGPIPIEQDQLAELADDNDEQFEAAFESLFKKEEETEGISRAEFRNALKNGGYSNTRWIAEFKSYLERVHDIVPKRLGAGARKKVYPCLQLRSMGVFV